MDAGIEEDSGPDSARSSARPGNSSSSSPAAAAPPLPPLPSRRPPSGVLTRLGTLLFSGTSTQAHGSMKQEEEKAERERSRPPQPRLGQEKRWEILGGLCRGFSCQAFSRPAQLGDGQ